LRDLEDSRNKCFIQNEELEKCGLLIEEKVILLERGLVNIDTIQKMS